MASRTDVMDEVDLTGKMGPAMASRTDVMDEVDLWLIAIALAALGAAVWLLAGRLLTLETDMELAGIKTPARTPGRND